ncbi:MAG: Arc family DNA-binding protein [Chloroflexi bacterium]|nr:Arc family DNA-binding protein [Chloroflexota bacterium]
MANISVRGIPDKTYKHLQKLADVQGRSVNALIVQLLEDAVKQEELRRKQIRVLEDLQRLRFHMDMSQGDSDTVTMLHQDRSR